MRIGSRVVRDGAWIGLLLAVGYEAAAAASGTISVQVWQGSPGVVASGARVEIVDLNTISNTNAQGRALFTVPAGQHQVRATLTGFCNSTVNVVVPDGQLITITFVLGSSPCSGPGPVTVTSAPGNAGASGGGSGSGGSGGGGGGGTSGVDRVYTGGTEPLFGLVDIRTGAASDPTPCENDRLVEGTAGVAELTTNALTLSDPGVTCHGAAWVFTADHAPWFSNTAATFPWSSAAGDVLTATLPADRLRVPVTIWFSYPTGNLSNFSSKMSASLALADTFLRTHRTGLVLTNSETSSSSPVVIDVGALTDPSTGSPPFPVIGSGCDNTSAITASTLVYRPNHLNIYVVQNIVGTGSPSGQNCRDYGAANVIFVKETAGFPVYVHEIGHALGLTRPHWGHANKIKDLYPDNVMDEGASVAGHISLGQIAHMHVDDISWLNEGHGTVAGSVRSRQAVSSPTLVTSCGCPGDAITDDCPRLDKDRDRTPAVPNVGLSNPACFVTASTTCVSLAPGGTTTVTLNGFTKSGGVTGFGEGIVSSASPTLATVIKPAVGGEGPGFVKAVVTAMTTPGKTDLLMWLGGTGVKIPIRIGLPCT